MSSATLGFAHLWAPRRRPDPAPAAPAVVAAGTSRIPSLDGLRGLSIALVVAFHALNTATRGRTGHDYDGPLKYVLNGGLGVTVFFVISGFLITHLLLRETARTGAVDLVDFYVRRTFRIWPAFFAYLAAIAVLHWTRVVGIAERDVVAAGLFAFNYAPHVGNAWVGQSWSLCVEEQFYLLWPALLLWAGRRRATLTAVAIVLAVPVVRYAEVRWLPGRGYWVSHLWQQGHTRMDSIMVGCLVALLGDHPRFRSAVARAFAWRAHVAALAWLFVGWAVLDRFAPPAVRLGIGYSLEAVAAAVMLIWAVQHPATPAGRLLNSRPLAHLGRISFSLYLWNVAFCIPLNHTWTGRFPFNVLCALAVAEASYAGVERPFLALRQRWSGRPRGPRPTRRPAAGLVLAAA